MTFQDVLNGKISNPSQAQLVEARRELSQLVEQHQAEAAKLAESLNDAQVRTLAGETVKDLRKRQLDSLDCEGRLTAARQGQEKITALLRDRVRSDAEERLASMEEDFDRLQAEKALALGEYVRKWRELVILEHSFAGPCVGVQTSSGEWIPGPPELRSTTLGDVLGLGSEHCGPVEDLTGQLAEVVKTSVAWRWHDLHLERDRLTRLLESGLDAEVARLLA